MTGGYATDFYEVGSTKKKMKKRNKRNLVEADGYKLKPFKRKRNVFPATANDFEFAHERALDRAWMKAVTNAFRGFDTGIPASEWSRMHFNLVGSASSVSGPFDPVSYQEQILDIMTMEGGPRKLVWLKSSRIGYTLCIMAAIAYLAHVSKNIAVYQPTEPKAKSWVKQSLYPTLLACEQIRSIMDAELLDKRQKSLMEMKLGSRVLRILSSVTPSSYREFDADAVIMDEADEYPLSVGAGASGTNSAGKAGQGSPITLGYRAIKNSMFKRMIIGSTPTDEGTSHIWREHQQATLKFAFHIPCPHCNVFLPLYWDNFVWETVNEELTIEEKAETIRYACPNTKCKKQWSYDKLPGALSKGLFVVPEKRVDKMYATEEDEKPDKNAGTWIDFKSGRPVLRNKRNKKIRWPNTVSFVVWAAYSPFYSWEEWCLEWLQAQGNLEKLISFTNTVRGLPFVDGDNQVVEKDIAKNTFQGVPNEIRFITVAIDVQAGDGEGGKNGFLSMLVVGWDIDQIAYVLEQRNFHGDISTDKGEGWVKLKEYLYSNPTWERHDGTKLPIGCLGIDEGYKGAVVRDVLAVMRRTCHTYMLKGNSTQSAPIFGLKAKLVPGTKGGKVYRHWVGVFAAKDSIMSRWKDNKIKVSASLKQSTLTELSSERRVREYRNGRQYFKYVKIGKRATEAADCLAYSLFMVLSFNPTMIEKKVRKPVVKKPAAKPVEAPETDMAETTEEVKEVPVTIVNTPVVRPRRRVIVKRGTRTGFGPRVIR